MLKHRKCLCHAALAETLIPKHPAHQPQPGWMQHCFSICHTGADADIEPHGHLFRNGDDFRIQRMDALQQKQFAGFPGQLPVLVDPSRGGKMIPGHPGGLAGNDALQLLVQIGNIHPCRRFQIQLSLCRHFLLLRCHGRKEIVHGDGMGLRAPVVQKALQQKCRRRLSRTRRPGKQDHRTLYRRFANGIRHLFQLLQKRLVCLRHGILRSGHCLIDISQCHIFHGRFTFLQS